MAKVYNTEAGVRNQAAYLLELDVSSKLSIISMLQDCWPDISASEEVLPLGRGSLRNSQALNPEPRRHSSQCHSIPEDGGEESEGDEDMSDYIITWSDSGMSHIFLKY